MLHCFKCGKDLPDNIAFCLYCGADLDADEETVVKHRPFDDPVPEPAIVEPLPLPAPVIRDKKSSGIGKFILGGLVGAGFVLLAVIAVGFLLFSIQDRQNGNANLLVNKNAVTNSPTFTPTRKPTATATATPSNANTNSAPETHDCVIINPEGGSVNLRRYCDTRDCSLDASTLYLQVEPGTEVETSGREPVVTGRYSWIQVIYNGEKLWVSAARIDCD